jgi:hypothetical protein
MSSSISKPTSFVQDATAVENVRSQITAKLRAIPRVDGQGRKLTGPDPTIIKVVDATVATGQPATMLAALQSATTSRGVNLAALVDSERFVRALGSIEPGDAAALDAAITDAVAANPSLVLAAAAPAMQPNRSQGSSANGAVPARPTTPEQSIANKLGQLPAVDGQGHRVN